MSDANTDNHPLGPVIRFLGFLCFSTIGMAIISLVILAEPLTQYFSNQSIIASYRRDIEALEKVRDQHALLLDNLDDPSVMERAAINYLNFVPGNDDPTRATDLPEPWPALKQALERIRQDDPPPPPSLAQVAVQTIYGSSSYQTILMALGAALVVVSMTCFCRSQPGPAGRPKA